MFDFPKKNINPAAEEAFLKKLMPWIEILVKDGSGPQLQVAEEYRAIYAARLLALGAFPEGNLQTAEMSQWADSQVDMVTPDPAQNIFPTHEHL